MTAVLESHGDGGARFLARRAHAWPPAAPAAAAPPALDLARDDLDWRPDARIVQATVDALDRGETHYTDRAGIAPLRQAIAADIAASSGLDYRHTDEVLVCGGGHEALFIAIQIVVRPGDGVIVPTPASPAIAEGVRLAGGEPLLARTSASDDYALTTDAVIPLLTPRTRVLILPSPAVPTGGVTTGHHLAALATLARDRDLTLIFDETYRPFIAGSPGQQNPATLAGMRERTITVGSFSARYAMTGWRAGYVVAHAPLLQPIAALKQSLTICSPAPSQWAALAALTGPQEQAAALVEAVGDRRAAALGALAALGLPAGQGRGGHFLFIDVRATGLSGEEFAARALREAGIRLRPGEQFGPGGEGHVRLTLDAPPAALATAIARLAPLVTRRQRGKGEES